MSSSTPSPLRTPSASFSPFSHLPVELVETIISATLPRYHALKTYAQRQKTLRSLCLVSRLFHQISKPLLFAVVQINRSSGRSWLSISEEEEEVDSSSQIRELVVYYAGVNVKFDNLRHIFRTQRHITKLVLISIAVEVDFEALSQMNHLSILYLANVTISAASSFTCRRLSDLFLFAVESSTPNFDERSFPSLRFISLWTYPGISLHLSLAKRTLDVFSLQAESIAINNSLASELSPEFFTRIKHKTLVEISSTRSRLVTHAPYLIGRTNGPTSTDTFTSLVRCIENLPSSTSSTLLYLPADLSPTFRHTTEIRDCVEALLGECKIRNVKVIFEDHVIEWDLFLRPTPDFERRIKEEKLQGSQV